MKDVWIVKIKFCDKDIADVVFSDELRAENYADSYRESSVGYSVTVVKREVL